MNTPKHIQVYLMNSDRSLKTKLIRIQEINYNFKDLKKLLITTIKMVALNGNPIANGQSYKYIHASNIPQAAAGCIYVFSCTHKHNANNEKEAMSLSVGRGRK